MVPHPSKDRETDIMAKASKSYNGYKNYAQWNQSLWLNNDERLYKIAKNYAVFCRNRNYTKDQAADAVFKCITTEYDLTHTPDGVKWSRAGIRAGMKGM